MVAEGDFAAPTPLPVMRADSWQMLQLPPTMTLQFSRRVLHDCCIALT
jgi:hypothetical protein